MQFWTGWQIWQQMCFVLGCCICLVFILGFGVRLWSRRRVNKLLRAAAESAERGEMVQVQEEDEVPFGVRAIEAGYEVEGIWNSKTATPLQSPTPSSSGPPTPSLKPRKLFKSKRSSSPASILRLEVPATVHIAVSSTDPAAQIPGRTTAQAAQHNQTSQSVTRPKAAGRCHTVIIGRRCDRQKSADDAASYKSFDTLERMQAHRRRQTAETGQFFPRTRRGTSGEIRPGLTPSVSDYGCDSQYSVSWPNDASDAPRANPSEEAIKPEVAQFSTPPKNHNPPIRPNKPPPSAWTGKTTELVDEKLEQARPTAPLTPESLCHHNENTRKINDGFEVLPAGTFDRPAPVKEFGLWPESPKTEDKKKRRKLQKRNRSNSSIKRSSSSDGVLSETENSTHQSTA